MVEGKGEEIIEVSEAVAELMEMGEEERVEYCKSVVKAVAEGFKEIKEIGHKVKQARAMKEYLAELNENMEEIRVAVIYTIKPEYRDTYIDLLEEFGDLSL